MKNNTLFTVLPYLWRNKATQLKITIILAAVCVLTTIILNLSVPIIFRNIVNQMSHKTLVLHHQTVILLIAYGICWTSSRFADKIQEILLYRPLQAAARDYSLDVFEHIHSLSLKFHLGRETGKVASSIERGQAMSSLIANVFLRIIPVFIEVLLAFFILWHFYGSQIGFLVIGILVIYMCVNYAIMNVFKKADKIYTDMDQMVDKHVVETLINSDSIKYLATQDFEIQRTGILIRNRENAIVNVFWAGTFTTCTQAVLLGGGLTLISYIIGQKVLAGSLTVGDFVLVNGYLLLLFNPLEQMAGHIRNVLVNIAAVKPSLELLEDTEIIPEIKHAPKIQIHEGNLTFENVSFSYLENRKLIKHLDLHIPAKSMVAIVGSTGSGKSTLSRLIFRFYDVNEGRILIDGQDIKNVSTGSLRQQIAAVPQDIVLLNQSIQYNICYGTFDATHADIEKVIQEVKLDKLIAKLPEGLNTLVGERGVKLSGGEKQRIGIARALLKKPKILIFDEATSSLDTKTERNIQKNIEEITKNITTILIAHRLSTVVHADMIIVLDKGVIVESGTHESLLALNGLYAALWGQQHGGN